MYKLVTVAGKLRGQEFELQDGENVLGRDSGCDIHFGVAGVSKRHVNITVTGDVCYVQDLGSSNGTFVNGKLVKRATVKNGDKIALPDSILQVVHVEEKKVIVKKKVSSDDDEEEEEVYKTGGDAPVNLVPKLIWAFRYKFMTFFHGINEEYEWKHLFAMLLGIFCLASVFFTIRPVLQNNKSILLVETSKRGELYAKEIEKSNKRALDSGNINQISTDFLESEIQNGDVESYRLFDMDGRILAPREKLNEYIAEDRFAVDTRGWFLENLGVRYRYIRKKLLDEGLIGIGKVIESYNPKIGKKVPVGIITIKFRPKSLAQEANASRVAYAESMVTTILTGIVFFLVVFFLTLRPIEEMKYQIEEAIRGGRKNLETDYLFIEMNPLRSSINALLQRIRELNNDTDEDFAEEESDGTYVDHLNEFMRGAQGPALILDSQKNLSYINMEAEDLTGIRENASQGMSLLDVSREKGFAATVIELCDNSANNNGTNQQGSYELGGYDFTVNIVSLIGKDNFAKAFYLTFVKDE